MSKKLKENQVLAANLIARGFSMRLVSKELNVREETICRWKKKDVFRDFVAKYQKEFLSNIESTHFTIIQKAMFHIDKALEDEDITIKEKAEISIRYLKTTTTYLSKNINEYTFQYNKKELEKKNNREDKETERQVDEILAEIAELKRNSIM